MALKYNGSLMMSLNAVKDLFKNEGITDIELILKPMQ